MQFPADESSQPTVVSAVLMAYYCAMGAGSSTCLGTMSKFLRNLTTPFALVAVYLLVVSLTPQILPADTQEDLASVLGGSLIIVATTMTMFQVDYTTNIIAPESDFAELLYSNGLAVRRVMATFWLVRTFFMTLFCIPAYTAYHFGVGFKAEVFAPVLLLYMYFINATCVVAMICQLQCGSKNAPVAFGVFSALQILSSGLIVDLNSLPAYWGWLSHINPLRYYLQGLLLLQFEGSPLALDKCEAYFPEAACPSSADFLDRLGFRSTAIATCFWALIIIHAAVTALYMACYTQAWQHLTCFRQTPGNANASSSGRASAAKNSQNADASTQPTPSVPGRTDHANTLQPDDNNTVRSNPSTDGYALATASESGIESEASRELSTQSCRVADPHHTRWKMAGKAADGVCKSFGAVVLDAVSAQGQAAKSQRGGLERGTTVTPASPTSPTALPPRSARYIMSKTSTPSDHLAAATATGTPVDPHSTQSSRPKRVKIHDYLDIGESTAHTPQVLVSQFTVDPSNLDAPNPARPSPLNSSSGVPILDSRVGELRQNPVDNLRNATLSDDAMRQQTTSFPPGGFSNVTLKSALSRKRSTQNRKHPPSLTVMRPSQAHTNEGTDDEIPSWHDQRHSGFVRKLPKLPRSTGPGQLVSVPDVSVDTFTPQLGTSRNKTFSLLSDTSLGAGTRRVSSMLSFREPSMLSFREPSNYMDNMMGIPQKQSSAV